VLLIRKGSLELTDMFNGKVEIKFDEALGWAGASGCFGVFTFSNVMVGLQVFSLVLSIVLGLIGLYRTLIKK
jgi:hypothetical protein